MSPPDIRVSPAPAPRRCYPTIFRITHPGGGVSACTGHPDPQSGPLPRHPHRACPCPLGQHPARGFRPHRRPDPDRTGVARTTASTDTKPQVSVSVEAACRTGCDSGLAPGHIPAAIPITASPARVATITAMIGHAAALPRLSVQRARSGRQPRWQGRRGRRRAGRLSRTGRRPGLPIAGARPRRAKRRDPPWPASRATAGAEARRPRRAAPAGPGRCQLVELPYLQGGQQQAGVYQRDQGQRGPGKAARKRR